MYPIVKHFHVVLVVTSLTLFQFRYWRYQVAEHNLPKLMKIMPHVIDTLLLVSGISLAVWAGFSPMQFDWLWYKLLALLLYILMGTLAMKKSGSIQWMGYLLATAAVVYMILAARQKTALPVLMP